MPWAQGVQSERDVWRNHHNRCLPVNPRYAPVLLLALCSACSKPFTPMSHGVTGYVSDRAWEIDADVYGALPSQPSTSVNSPGANVQTSLDQKVTDDLERVASILQNEGRPLLLDRAQVDFDVRTSSTNEKSSGPVSWHARVQSLATYAEVPDGAAAYTSDARALFHLPPPEAYRTRPGYGQLAADGVLEVGVLFGQMSEGDLAATDDGLWSQRAFEQDLAAHGYAKLDRPGSAWATWESSIGSLRVSVDVAGPEVFPLLGDADQARSTLRSLVASHELVYLNGHANQESLDALGDPQAFEPATYRVVVLDLCWSYFLYSRPALDAAPWGQTHVVNASGRVITGSIESFSLLLHGVTKSASESMQGSDSESPTWIDLVRAMNEQAAGRAEARRGKVIADLEPPELYGVSGVWEPRGSAAAPLIAMPVLQKQ